MGGRLVETGLQGWVVLRRDEASSWRVAAAISSFSCAIPGWWDGGWGNGELYSTLHMTVKKIDN